MIHTATIPTANHFFVIPESATRRSTLRKVTVVAPVALRICGVRSCPHSQVGVESELVNRQRGHSRGISRLSTLCYNPHSLYAIGPPRLAKPNRPNELDRL
jgi:hypothetical protein